MIKQGHLPSMKRTRAESQGDPEAGDHGLVEAGKVSSVRRDWGKASVGEVETACGCRPAWQSLTLGSPVADEGRPWGGRAGRTMKNLDSVAPQSLVVSCWGHSRLMSPLFVKVNGQQPINGG